ncbi:MAG TPA: tetratricopeptide repeat protein, partial [Opitutales bacterium]|nr:tetratricopeptide repeat protein [Opitutales bacterium]
PAPAASDTSAPTNPDNHGNFRIVFPNATVNGRPARVALDTGDYVAMLTGAAAQRLQVSLQVPADKSSMKPAFSKYDLGISDPTQVSLGSQSFTASLPIIDLNFSSLAPDFDFLVGWNEIKNNILVFDGEHRTVTATDKLPPETASWLKLKIHPYDILALEMPLPDGKTGFISIDTGSPTGVTLPPLGWFVFKRDHPQAILGMREGSTVAGEESRPTAWTDKISLGSLELKNVTLLEADEVEMLGLDGYLGTLGLAALARVDLVVDSPGGFAYLHPKPAPDPTPKPEVDKNGAIDLVVDNTQDWTFVGDFHLSAANIIEFSAKSQDKQGDFDGALAEYDHALELEPQNAEVFVNRGAAKDIHQDFTGALADFNHALEINPQYADAYAYRAVAENGLKDYAHATADNSHALELDPFNFNACLNLAISKNNNQDYAGAIDLYNRAIAIDSTNPTAYIDRAEAKISAKDNAGAMADFAHALELDPHDANILKARANARMQNDPAGSIVDFNEYLKTNPNDATAYAHRAGAKYNQGDYAGAMADYSAALDLDPKVASTWEWRGKSHAALDEYPAAVADYNHALELEPKNSPIISERAIAEQDSGNTTAALADYDQFIQQKPGKSDFERYYRHELLLAQGKTDPDLGKAVAGWPDGWDKTLGQYLVGALDEKSLLAAAEVKDAKPVDGKECEAYYFIGLSRLRVSDVTGARDYFQKSLATRLTSYREYQFARVELARLDAAKK